MVVGHKAMGGFFTRTDVVENLWLGCGEDLEDKGRVSCPIHCMYPAIRPKLFRSWHTHRHTHTQSTL